MAISYCTLVQKQLLSSYSFFLPVFLFLAASPEVKHSNVCVCVCVSGGVQYTRTATVSDLNSLPLRIISNCLESSEASAHQHCSSQQTHPQQEVSVKRARDIM